MHRLIARQFLCNQFIDNTIAGCSFTTGRKEISAAERLTTRTAAVPTSEVNYIIRNGSP
jgi:hypothetical protein